MKDFTFQSYKNLLEKIKALNWQITTLENYKEDSNKVVILRHDVDRRPQNALSMAKLEAGLGIKASYYFRIVSESYDEEIIQEIAGLGHEIGYHYENLSHKKGNYEKAINDFGKNLGKLKQLYPIQTMCMHGSPTSIWDNRKLWEKYDYRKYGINCEPYFDLDFNKIFYITDAGRSWNNEKVSIRDKVESNFDFEIVSTNDIMDLIQSDNVPSQIMISTHPHNWAKTSSEWWKIYLWQSFKNLIKRILILRNNRKSR